MTVGVTRSSQALLFIGGLLPGLPAAAQSKGSDPRAYLTAAAVRKIPPLPDTMSIRPTGRTREFNLDIRPGVWEPAEGVLTPAITINGTVPGPFIRVTEGIGP